MKFIAHRGNMVGPNPDCENHPEYLMEAIQNDFDIEVDLWYHKNKWYLGHDEPQYKVSLDYLNKIGDDAWVHCKNLDALDNLSRGNGKHLNLHFFWHQNDDYTLTRFQFIWTFPRRPLAKYSIAVMPEKASYTKRELKKCYAICSDEVMHYRDIL